MSKKRTDGTDGPDLDPLSRRLQERIAYNKAMLAEERAATEKRDERRRRLKRLLSLGFIAAD